MDTADAIVIGSGPNGLVAAAVLARAGWQVTVLERSAVAGGAVQSAELTLPGYVHDTYSAFYGLLHASPVFAELGLDRRVTWATFPAAVAAASDPDHAAVCYPDPHRTAEGLAATTAADGDAWLELCRWWTRIGRRFLDLMLAPLPSVRPALSVLRAAGLPGLLDTARLQLQPVEAAAAARLRGPAAQALLAAGASHADLAVDQTGSTPAALILAMVAQHHGMPVPAGGAGRLASALVDIVREAGGEVCTGREVTRVLIEKGRAIGVETAGGGVRARRAVLADTGPGALMVGLVGTDAVPSRYLDGLRQFRYGTGIFKVDLALAGPVPWRAEGLGECGVVHLTGDLASMATAGFQARRGLLPEQPMLIVGQQSIADPSRAPAGGHTLWVETHVPPELPGTSWAAASATFLDRVLARLESHAPGLGSKIKSAAVRTPTDLEGENPNLVGGDLGGGSVAIDQQLVFRPVPGWFRYATPVKRLYLCSASAHPGGGVHGMVGRNCAKRVLADARVHRI